MQNSITLFATYWNERDWIEASLAQIDILNPKEVWIVDGCFDPTVQNRSTDGTREIIEAWVAKRPNTKLVSALRLSRIGALWYLFGRGMTWWNWPLRILMAMYYSRTHQYRLNQAATFAKLLRESGIQPNEWFMNYDADQFYTDETILRIKEIVTNNSDHQLITANEKTFFNSFSEMTTDYEKRDYNNLPHRYTKRTLIVPTRDIVTEKYPRPVAYGKDPDIKKISAGSYHHYKFRPYTKEREQATYTVGDRKPPKTSSYKTQLYTGAYPNVVQPLINTLRNS